MTLEYLELMEDMNKEKSAGQALPVPRKIRGTLTIKADDDVEFKAQRATGVSSQEEISHTSQSKLYRTVGEKKNKMVAHLTCDTNSSDPRADLIEQVEKLTAGMASKARPKQRGRVLVQNDALRVTLNQTQRIVEVVMTIDLNATPNYNDRLMKLMYETSQCFAINQTSFLKVSR